MCGQCETARQVLHSLDTSLKEVNSDIVKLEMRLEGARQLKRETIASKNRWEKVIDKCNHT